MVVQRVPCSVGFGISEAVVVEPGAAGRWVFVSGQVAHAPEARGKDLATQASGCFDQIDAVLRQCGGHLHDVVRITAFLISLDDFAAYDRVRRERFGDALPASASVRVAGLLGENAKVEIDAVAFVPGSEMR